MGSDATQSTGRRPLAPLPRFLGAFATWAILFVSTPGLVTQDGLWLGALVALVPWALVASRPGRLAFGAEWLAAAIGISAACFWSTYVVWLTLLAVALVPATYMAFAGVVLRRIARSWPLAVAVPVAWIGLETLRMVVEPPLGFGWMRLGHHAHAELWLAGSARVFGTAGVGFAMAAFAGGIADFVRARRGRKLQAQSAERGSATHTGAALARPKLVLAAALAPILLAIVLSLATSAPPMRDGPRVLLVQPAFEQERKMSGLSGEELLERLIQLTRRGMAEAENAGEPVDIVAWGETCIPFALAAPDLLERWDRGIRPRPWDAERIARDTIERMRDTEAIIVGDILYGRNGGHPVLPQDVAFIAGAEHFVVADGSFARQNAVIAWEHPGERTGVGGKVHLVPGGETMNGLERFDWIRATAFDLAGYVPDLVAFDRTEVLPVRGREGKEWRVGVTVCFDNAFEGPYTEPLQEGPLDFHLIASNEAWYRESWEYDQMMAFSRMIAIETGRSFVRATNAGITCVIGPDGSDRARLEVGGRDRMVSGSLRAVVPVPLEPQPGERAPRPVYAATWRWWLGLWMGLALLLAVTARSQAVTGPQRAGS